jgi:hypothetical protein
LGTEPAGEEEEGKVKKETELHHPSLRWWGRVCMDRPACSLVSIGDRTAEAGSSRQQQAAAGSSRPLM